MDFSIQKAGMRDLLVIPNEAKHRRVCRAHRHRSTTGRCARHTPRLSSKAVGWVLNPRVLLELEGCTITGGAAGGLWIHSGPADVASDVVISDCTFSGNRAFDTDFLIPGALYAYIPGVVLVRCSFIGNAGALGALYAEEAVLDHCQFSGNYGWEGAGAAHLYYSILTDCVFTGNTAEYDGGALLCRGDCDAVSCAFIGNEASIDGGGAYTLAGDTRLIKSVLVGNEGGARGGAWFVGSDSSLTVVNCTTSGNRSSKGDFLAISLPSDKPPSRATVLNSILSDAGP